MADADDIEDILRLKRDCEVRKRSKMGANLPELDLMFYTRENSTWNI